MTPERILLGVLTAAVAYLGWEARRIVIDDDQDRIEWQRDMQDWRRERLREQFSRPLS